VKNKYFKYNKEDILEILTEHLARENGFGTFSSKAELVFDDGCITFIAAIGELENDDVTRTDLAKLYHEMDYNGTHDGSGLTDEQMTGALDKMIETGDF
jgi:hypothetical protein